MTEILHKELSYILNGILFETHNELGRFVSEAQVCDVIEKKLQEKKVPYFREHAIPTTDNGEQVGRHRVDFLIDGKIVLEIKCKKYLQKEDYIQTQRYLKALNLALGIAVNFHDERIYPKRILNGQGKQ